MGYHIQETHINRTKGYRYHESNVTETHIETLGELFKQCQQEFGRCEGKIFVDTAVQHEPRQVGWVFVKNQEYEDLRRGDTERTYIREVWVTVFGDMGTEAFEN